MPNFCGPSKTSWPKAEAKWEKNNPRHFSRLNHKANYFIVFFSNILDLKPTILTFVQFVQQCKNCTFFMPIVIFRNFLRHNIFFLQMGKSLEILVTFGYSEATKKWKVDSSFFGLLTIFELYFVVNKIENENIYHDRELHTPNVDMLVKIHKYITSTRILRQFFLFWRPCGQNVFQVEFLYSLTRYLFLIKFELISVSFLFR